MAITTTVCAERNRRVTVDIPADIRCSSGTTVAVVFAYCFDAAL
jgi:hypothetical protein